MLSIRLFALKQRLSQPNDAEKKMAKIDLQTGRQLIAFLNPWAKRHLSMYDRCGAVLLLMLFAIDAILHAILVKLGIKKSGWDGVVREIVPGRLWQLQYTSDMGLSNNSTLIRGQDGTLCFVQPPKPEIALVNAVAALGELTVIVEPDTAHNSGARQWKLLMPDVTFLCTGESAQRWKECGDDSHIDAVFGEQGSPLAASTLANVFLTKHIRVPFLEWEEYAHVFELPGGPRVILQACPVLNLHSDNPVHQAWLTLRGTSHYVIPFYSKCMYCAPGLFLPGGSFETFVRALEAEKPDLVIVKHGDAVPGDRVGDIGFDGILFPQRLKRDNTTH